MDLNSIIYGDNAQNIQLVINAKDLRDFTDNIIAFAKHEIKAHTEPEYYTTKELEELLHVTAPTLIDYRAKGKIPQPVRVGRYMLYDKAEVNRAIREGKVRVQYYSKNRYL